MAGELVLPWNEGDDSDFAGRARHAARIPVSKAPRTPSTEFEELIANYAGLIRSVVVRVCGDLAELHAEDAEQEIRLAVWRFLDSGKKIVHPYSFLLKVATRITIRVIRKARDRGFDTEPGEGLDSLADPAATLDPAEVAGIRKAVGQSLALLTPKRRAAVRAYLMGMNHEEIAQVFAWTPSAARHAVYKGLAKLRVQMRKQGIHLADTRD